MLSLTKLRGRSRCHPGQWEEKSDQLSRFESGKVSERGLFRLRSYINMRIFFFLSLYKGWLFCHPRSSEKWEGSRGNGDKNVSVWVRQATELLLHWAFPAGGLGSAFGHLSEPYCGQPVACCRKCTRRNLSCREGEKGHAELQGKTLSTAGEGLHAGTLAPGSELSLPLSSARAPQN